MTVLIKADPANQHKACAGVRRRRCHGTATPLRCEGPRTVSASFSCAPQTGPTSRLGNIKQVQLARSVLEKF